MSRTQQFVVLAALAATPGCVSSFQSCTSSPAWSCGPAFGRVLTSITLPATAKLSTTALNMGAFDKRNKQADLQRKMELAKQQKKDQDDDISDGTKSTKMPVSAEEIKLCNDKKRFEDLLNSESATVSIMDEFKDGSYLTKTQEEDELTRYGRRGGKIHLFAVEVSKSWGACCRSMKFLSNLAFILRKRTLSFPRSCAEPIDKIYEGNPAPATAFENLVHWKSEKALGASGAEKILPWVKPKSPEKAKDYVVVICDPRTKSVEFRQTIKTLEKNLPKDISDRLLVINADSPLDNRK